MSQPDKFKKMILPVIIIICMLTAACGSRNRKIKHQDIMIQSLKTSRVIMDAGNQEMHQAILSEYDDPKYHYCVEQWLEIDRKAEALSRKMVNYLGQQQTALYSGEKDVDELSKITGALYSYQKKILETLPQISGQLREIFDIPEEIENNTNRNELAGVLSCFLNQVRVAEYKVSSFCLIQCREKVIRYEYLAPVVGISSSCAKPGEKLIVTAGLVQFSGTPQPEFLINGKAIPANAKGYIIHQHRVSRKPGFYNLPVSITVLDDDGSRQTITQTLTYEVIAKD